MNAKIFGAFRLLPLLLLTALFGCGMDSGGGSSSGAPVISSFTANPTSIAAGNSAQLSWVITGSPTSLTIDNNVGSVSGTNTIVTPVATTTYTLTASNSSGDDTEVATVTVGGTGTGTSEDGLAPSGSFGVSLSQTGPFLNDAGGNITSASDPNVVNVAAGNTFYAQVAYADPGGIASISIVLRNSSPPGLMAPLAQGQSVGGFTLGAEVSGCVLDGTQTAVSCVYPISVASGTPNITGLDGSGSEFAYVFRTNVTDAAGNTSDTPPRGYVTVGGNGGGGNGGGDDGDDGDTPPPTPDPDPTPTPGNSKPTVTIGGSANRSVETEESTMLTATGRDANGDTLAYQWNASPSAGVTFSAATSSATNVEFANEGDYTVTVTVSDGKGGTGKDTVNFDVNDEADGDDGDDGDTPTANQAPTARAGTDIQNAKVGATVTLDGTGSTDPNPGETATLKYAWTLAVQGGSSANNLLNNENTSRPSLKPDAAVTYVATLVVTDARGLSSAPDTVLISVPANRAPIANAGQNQTDVEQGTTVTLNGTGSSDPDAGETETLKYAWTLTAPDNSSATSLLNNGTTAKPTFRVPETEAMGTEAYVAILTVTDTNGASSTASVRIFVDPQ